MSGETVGGRKMLLHSTESSVTVVGLKPGGPRWGTVASRDWPMRKTSLYIRTT